MIFFSGSLRLLVPFSCHRKSSVKVSKSWSKLVKPKTKFFRVIRPVFTIAISEIESARQPSIFAPMSESCLTRGSMLARILSILLALTTTALAEPLTLHTRSRVEPVKGSGHFLPVEKAVTWEASKTAIIICDMWDKHWCKGATERVGEMAPVMNKTVQEARKRGVFIIHAPSETMEFYKDTPQRKRAQEAPLAKTDEALGKWRSLDRSSEGSLPIDDSDGGCDDIPRCKGGPPYPWKRQIAAIEIAPEDAITDKGQEVYNLLQQRGIDNLIVMGVHANMCVLGRSFAIRQMVKLGKNVVLMRDHTDTMYCSRMSPFVNHFRGNDLVVEHIEKYWCPSVTSSDITGKPVFEFQGNVRARVALVVSEDEYEAKSTVPEFARNELASRFGFDCSIIQSDSKTNLPGLEHLKNADAAIFYIRRRTLPEDQLNLVKGYLNSGKPLVAIRTSSHAFQNWLEFDGEVLGGHYSNHYGKPKDGGIATKVKIVPDAAKHPVLHGIPEFGSMSWLYKTSPLATTTTALLQGTQDQFTEPVAWVNNYKGGRVFYTSLGHPDDFKLQHFRRLLVNGTLWTLGQLGPPATNTQTRSAATQSTTPESLAANAQVLEHIKKFKGQGQTVEAGQGIQALSPAESLKRFKVSDGLQISLAAAEPDVRQPVCINFDERGRMWVVQYLQYPFPAGLKVVKYDEYLRAQFDKVPQAPPNHVPGADKITIFEDKDRDGYYESHKDFVTGLNITTSALPGRGGVWVMNPPYLLFYPDKDRDDIPDGPPEVHLSGFGLEDTHAVANSLTWGPDGWLYGAQGSTCTATVKGIRFLGQAIWRYHPDTKNFELYAEGGGNTFSIELDRAGRLYSGTNWDKHRGLQFAQGGYYVKNWGKHGPLTHPNAYGFFPHMSHEGDQARFSHALIIYEGNGLPDRYFGKMFSIVPLKNRVQVSELIADGSTFKTRDTERAVETDDKWFRPVDIKAGPDGAIYLADWYDVRLTHVDPRDNWDRSNGRIWRISAKDQKMPPIADLSNASSTELLKLLAHPNKWHRQQALRLIAEKKDTTARSQLSQWLITAHTMTLETFWALNLLGKIDDTTASAFSEHGDPEGRLWAVRLLGDRNHFSNTVATRLQELARYEKEPRVRSQLASSAKRWPSAIALPVIRELVARSEDKDDPHIPLLLWWALESKAISDRTEVLRIFNNPDLWREPIAEKHIMHRLARRYGAEGGKEDLEAVARIMKAAPDAAQRERILEALAEAFKGKRPEKLPSSLKQQIAQTSAKPELTLLKIRLGAATAADIDAAIRLASTDEKTIEALGEGQVKAALPTLLNAATTSRSHNVRRSALSALQHFEDPAIASRLLRHYRGLPVGDATQSQILNLLSKRSQWSMALLEAVDSGKIPRSDFSFEVVERLRLYQDEGIGRRVKEHWSAARQTPSELRKRIEAVGSLLRNGSGDSTKGRESFTSLCASCHKLHGEGQTIGPELTGYERDNLDFLLLAIIDPNAAIREEYTNFELETTDGLLLTGYVVERAPHSVTIEDGEQGRVVVEKAKIKTLRASPVSRMPEGLLDSLAEQQIRDLFAYLQSPGPVAESK